ncbi:hypothetical protein QQ054_26130 [Oscillatoria amoena NRMC-F 0135]|nr:hypothetical protein [Oscillatoria amoena NRMC-F 0135]
MKKIFLPLLLLCIIQTASAQKTRTADSLRNSYKREFLLSPLSFFVGGFEVGYGMINSKGRNLRFIGGYYFSENPGAYNEDEPLTSTPTYTRKNMEGARLEVQYLLMKPSTNGMRFYGGPYGVVKTISMDVSRTINGSSTVTTLNYKARATAVSAGIILGMRQYVMDNIFFDAYIGGGVNIPVSSEKIDDVHLDVVNPYKRSINPRAGITFGYAF